MRMLEKNKRLLYYAIPTDEVSIKDEYGNDTLETEVIYSDPMELKVNYSPATGREAVEVFGSTTDYSRVLAFGKDCPLTERAVLWIGVETSSPANYEVRRIADGLDSVLVAIQEKA